jgi:exodeoxyribonuclease-5
MAFYSHTDLCQRLCQAMPFTPTASQNVAIQALSSLLLSTAPRPVLMLKGYAGTGKTSLMRALCQLLSDMAMPMSLMAPTGRAAKVLAERTGMTAYTIHKVIYRQESATDLYSHFNINYNRGQGTLFIVDEASMISDSYGGDTEFGSGRLLTDLLSFVFSKPRCRLLLIGDPAQLPPVGLNDAPALDLDTLRSFGLDVSTVLLTDIVRQDSHSDILTNAAYLRSIIENIPDFNGYPHLVASPGSDVERLSGAELIETLISCNDKYGTSNTLVITRSNKRANRFNQGIRNSVMFREEEITRGDLLIVAKNNYLWLSAIADNLSSSKGHDFIANGDIAEVVRVGRYTEMYGLRFAKVSLRFLEHDDVDLDVTLMLSVLNSDFPKLTQQDEQALYEAVAFDYSDITDKRKQVAALRQDPWLNALQVKFAYAVTCHKAQGGQWDVVFIDIGYVAEEQLTTELVKWLYTAITRAKKKVYLVNFPDDFF